MGLLKDFMAVALVAAAVVAVGLLGMYIWYLYEHEQGQMYMPEAEVRAMTLSSAPKLCGEGLYFDGEKCVDGNGRLPFVCESC